MIQERHPAFAREVVHDLELLAADHATPCRQGHDIDWCPGFRASVMGLHWLKQPEPFSRVHCQFREANLQRMADHEKSLMRSQDRPSHPVFHRGTERKTQV